MNMANLDLETPDIAALRRIARRGRYRHRARLMLAAASLSAASLVAVAATVLGNLL